jgi:1,4-alpha-glucan branching enzyme
MRKFFIGLLALFMFCAVSVRAEDDRLVKVTFQVYAPGANTVEMIGDFNSWLPNSHFLQKASEDDMWSTVITIDRDVRRIEYQYLINGQGLLVDSEQPVVTDDFGGKNNVRILP